MDILVLNENGYEEIHYKDENVYSRTVQTEPKVSWIGRNYITFHIVTYTFRLMRLTKLYESLVGN